MTKIQAVLFGVIVGLLMPMIPAALAGEHQMALGSLFVLAAVLVGNYSIQAWRRTGLALATAAMINSTVLFFVVGCWLLEGPPIPPERTAGVVLALWLWAAIGPALLVVESRRSPDAWRRWRKEARSASFVTLFTGEHIPYLRD